MMETIPNNMKLELQEERWPRKFSLTVLSIYRIMTPSWFIFFTIAYNTYITYNTNITYSTTYITYNTTVTYTTIALLTLRLHTTTTTDALPTQLIIQILLYIVL